ncbi:MAG: ImmA/IrrE family metallo-endopeptidase [Mesorhizobium sp.]|uniref:ImmA/IrrE family metallo-endopeptidase n=1 Tax=Mesorhizobium sp. TaxID=1871066 RepID=UPI000FE50DF7|nr:ImmA/IrrE family metallo-endopeptidase [Mesorhizobium sp.]RWL83515.1 MAG: ImmA/IrrE family metallo-endopeptidase [Mesorhizobium sp.]RWL90666.1 MAG: ImmA/IrrE family metallo-endopeptidase [Mesorhizobium sp.]RWM00256.1 MAG: ImmA/IrrE family metallo-endopeptidase [Mesorhizobium sp.]
MKKAAAVDLWVQLLARARANDWSSFQDPEYSISDTDREVVRQAFLDAGWHATDIEALEDGTRQRSVSAPVTSEGVNRNSEAMLERLLKPLMSGLSPADRLLADEAHFVVEPKAGPLVSTINVPMTDETIIAMGTHFTRYCGLIARAYVRTCNLLPFATGMEYSENDLRLKLRRNPNLLFYWWRIFTSYALTGTHCLTEFKPSTKDEILFVEQMAAAMEIFALAHELGHHCLAHGRQLNGSSDSRSEEFEADSFAAKLCETIEGTFAYREMQGYSLPNPYLWSGAGGILLLGSIEIFRKVKEKIFYNPHFNTHPDFVDRADKITHRNVLQIASYQTRLDFCSSARNVLKCVLLELEPIMRVWPFEELSLKLPEDWEVAQEGRTRSLVRGGLQHTI